MKKKEYKNINIKYIYMEKNIYINTLLKKRILLKSAYLNKNFEKNIQNILKEEVGDKCITEGYVKSDTIKIIKRTLPKIITSNFSADSAINIIYKAEVCNPAKGNIIPCEITHVNKIGLMAKNGPLSIIIGKQYHNNKNIFKNIKVGDNVDIIVIDKRYIINGEIIEIVGKLTTDKESKKKNKTKPLDEEIDEVETKEQEPLEEQPDSDVEEIEEEDEADESEKEDISEFEEDIIAGEEEDDEDDEDMLERSIDEEVSEESELEDFV